MELPEARELLRTLRTRLEAHAANQTLHDPRQVAAVDELVARILRLHPGEADAVLELCDVARTGAQGASNLDHEVPWVVLIQRLEALAEAARPSTH